MKQLNVFCEGQTEQQFCAQVLQPHLFPAGDGILHTLAVGEKDHHHVFGLGKGKKYAKVRKFISNTMKQREGKQVYFTSFFDLYGLPTDFPGKDLHKRNPANPTTYVTALEQAFGEDIKHHHFVPYLQLHEFETLLLSDPDAFRISFENCLSEIYQLKILAASEKSIEHINDGHATAPSKRIIEVIPEYEGRKASAGPDIAEFIGTVNIRAKCPHFNQWLLQLENLNWNER